MRDAERNRELGRCEGGLDASAAPMGMGLGTLGTGAVRR